MMTLVDEKRGKDRPPNTKAPDWPCHNSPKSEEVGITENVVGTLQNPNTTCIELTWQNAMEGSAIMKFKEDLDEVGTCI